MDSVGGGEVEDIDLYVLELHLLLSSFASFLVLGAWKTYGFG